MANLTKANLQTSFDGHLWIITNRQKTGTESNIRLLEVAKHIIEKYEGMAEGDKLFYAKITAEKVSRDMEKLSQRIEQMENFICQTI